ncbi:hypothetical protein BGZ47_001236 [Haplosporangium gracile]|nr:hypothetical protein BGZ47_001236 [Haplosporangium gracile]
MIRNTITKVAPTATRAISNSTKTNAAISLEASSSMPAHNAAAPSNGRFKAIAYTVLGSTAVVAGVSHLLKDEVVYWTPNVRN